MQLFKFFHTENTSNFKTQTAKNGGFCEELLSENDFEAVLVNFCCHEYGGNASEAFQKISTRILLRVFLRFFFKLSPPQQNRCPAWGTAPLKNDASSHLKNNPPPSPHIKMKRPSMK